MSAITKERIEQLANGNNICKVTREERIELARIALASLEAEPVAWLLSGGGAKNNVSFDSGNAYADPLREVTPLYTAPPAPVSVPDLLEQFAEFMAAESIKSGDYPDGWQCKASNAAHEYAENIRAAMLQGAEPSKMSGIMPDYEGSTMTQRELFQAGWEAHHSAMLQAGAPVQFGWSKGHFGYHTLFNAIGKAVNIQGNALSISVSAFEDAMLTAAPQQEINNG